MSYHSYLFFDAEPSLRTLPKARLEKSKKEFTKILEASTEVRTHAYATLGLKAGTRFMLHMNAETPDAIQLLVCDLLHTRLGAHLDLSYTLLGVTRPSQYNPDRPPKESDWDAPHRYFVVYPFTKTIEWHLMPYEERRKVMKSHVEVGRKYSVTIAQRLLYSFGIDDPEFIVSYQMDTLEDFQTLVMELRGNESRRYTKSDTPIFTCIHMSPKQALKML